MSSASGSDTPLRARIRQQEVVSDLGQRALEIDDLDQLMHEAAAAVAETLDCEYAKVLELLPGDEAVLLRQGVGWQEGLVGEATVPTDLESQAGYTLVTEEPVVVDDMQTEDRFSGPDLLHDHGVRSGISVVIGSVDDPWGVLGVHTTEQREFSQYDATFVQSVANVLASAIESHRATTELEEIYGRISDAFFGLDEDWRFTYLNEQAHELINPDGRTLEGTYVWDEFPAATERKFKPKYEQAMYEQETVAFEEHYPEPLDTWFEVRAYPSETGLSVYFKDITERKEREQALTRTKRRLEQSEQRYRTLAESFPNGIVTLYDDDLRYTVAEGQAFEYIPASKDELEGKTPAEAWDDATAAVLEPLLKGALWGEEGDVEVSYAGREWRVYAVPITDSDGEVFGGMTMAQDITEQVYRQQQLERSNRRLEESNERLEQFAYAASHDLQEPLRMVSSYLRLIEDRYGDDLDEDATEFLEFAVDGADRMREMIDALLDYSRVETRGDPFEPVDLETVFEEVLADLQLGIDETAAEVTADALPQVKGDPNQLRQLFQNLLDNALTYAGDEPPQVHVSVERDGEMWAISVRDEGIGIDSNDIDEVFEVFQRLHSREEYEGTGIGLALCERIVERHGGEIWVESEPGEGSTFTFTLPAVDDEQ